MKLRHRLLATAIVLAGASVPVVTSAEVLTREVTPGQIVTLDVSGSPDDSNDTAVRFENLSQTTGDLSVEFRAGPSLLTDQTVDGGFQLLDGTLVVTSTIPNGEKRVRYRMEYIRRDVRRLGLRANSARIMRLRESVWKPARRRILRRESAEVRRLRDHRADFTLGHYGFSRERRYAWAVVDVNSSYAIGAMPVPEPASWLLIVLGGGMLLFHLLHRRRRRTAS